MSLEFLWQVFMRGIPADRFTTMLYVWTSLWMGVLAGGLVYLILLVLLQTRVYRGSQRIAELVDSDLRVALCGAWATYVVMVLLWGTIASFYWRAVLPSEPTLWLQLGPLAAHVTVLTGLLLMWLSFHLALRRQAAIAKRTVTF